jgi:modulator of FtsH protease
MSAYDPARWSDFALAQLGASAALLGLVFVGLSINLRDVVGSRRLVNRAAEAIIELAAVLVSATAVLIPDSWVLLIEILR